MMGIMRDSLRMRLVVTGSSPCGNQSSFELSLRYFASPRLPFGLGTSMTKDIHLNLELILTHVIRKGSEPTFNTLGTRLVFG